MVSQLEKYIALGVFGFMALYMWSVKLFNKNFQEVYNTPLIKAQKKAAQDYQWVINAINSYESVWWLYYLVGIAGLILLFKSMRKTGWTLVVLGCVLLSLGEIARQTVYQMGMLEHMESVFK